MTKNVKQAVRKKKTTMKATMKTMTMKTTKTKMKTK